LGTADPSARGQIIGYLDGHAALRTFHSCHGALRSDWLRLDQPGFWHGNHWPCGLPSLRAVFTRIALRPNLPYNLPDRFAIMMDHAHTCHRRHSRLFAGLDLAPGAGSTEAGRYDCDPGRLR